MNHANSPYKKGSLHIILNTANIKMKKRRSIHSEMYDCDLPQEKVIQERT